MLWIKPVWWFNTKFVRHAVERSRNKLHHSARIFWADGIRISTGFLSYDRPNQIRINPLALSFPFDNVIIFAAELRF